MGRGYIFTAYAVNEVYFSLYKADPFCKNPENYVIKSLSADSYRMVSLSRLK